MTKSAKSSTSFLESVRNFTADIFTKKQINLNKTGMLVYLGCVLVVSGNFGDRYFGTEASSDEVRVTFDTDDEV